MISRCNFGLNVRVRVATSFKYPQCAEVERELRDGKSRRVLPREEKNGEYTKRALEDRRRASPESCGVLPQVAKTSFVNGALVF